MRGKSVIRVSDLHKTFRRGPEAIHVLKGLALEVVKGEGAAVIGASGSGKSTLLHLLGGLERPEQGRHGGGTGKCACGRATPTMPRSQRKWWRRSPIFSMKLHFFRQSSRGGSGEDVRSNRPRAGASVTRV